MGNSSFAGIIISGLWIALVITLPILVIIVVVRAIRRMTPHQKEMQRLLGQAVTLLEENNRLLNQQIAGKRPDENREKTPPAGESS